LALVKPLQEHILLFLTENVGFFVFLLFFSVFSFFSFFFETVCFDLFRFYTETENFDVSIEPKQTEEPPKQLKESTFGYFSENLGLFQFVSVFYEAVLFVSVVSI
jgi:hypothetical protein